MDTDRRTPSETSGTAVQTPLHHSATYDRPLRSPQETSSLQTSHICSWKNLRSFSISSAISAPLISVRIMPCCRACSFFSFSILLLRKEVRGSQTESQTGGERGSQTESQTESQTGGERGSQTERQSDREFGQRDKEIDRDRENQMERLRGLDHRSKVRPKTKSNRGCLFHAGELLLNVLWVVCIKGISPLPSEERFSVSLLGFVLCRRVLFMRLILQYLN